MALGVKPYLTLKIYGYFYGYMVTVGVTVEMYGYRHSYTRSKVFCCP